MRLSAPDDWAGAGAGQFVMIRSTEGLDPYLRRAFSIHDVSRGPEGVRIEILGKIVGRGTARLAGTQVGDRLAVLGPLGRAFTPPAEAPVALVAGGVGSAPLLLLARQLLAAGSRFSVFYGGRSREDLARQELFAGLATASGGTFVATTEDGSFGRRGLVTEPLEESLARRDFRRIYACGPQGLLRRLAALSAQHGVPGEAALETPMGCGFGACLGCAVALADGAFALCCREGPVFAFERVRW